MFNFFKKTKPTKEDYKLDAAIAGVPDNEVDLRFACFEAMSLAFHGKQADAQEKLKEVEKLKKKLGT
jgi:hypothetical protein